jgi:hypothetical protein
VVTRKYGSPTGAGPPSNKADFLTGKKENDFVYHFFFLVAIGSPWLE